MLRGKGEFRCSPEFPRGREEGKEGAKVSLVSRANGGATTSRSRLASPQRVLHSQLQLNRQCGSPEKIQPNERGEKEDSLPFIEQIRSRSSQIDDLGAPVPVLL